MAVLERMWPSWSFGGRPGALVAVLECMWPSWSVGGCPGALVAVLERMWPSWSVGGQPGDDVGSLMMMLGRRDCPGRLDPTRSIWIRPGVPGSDQGRLDSTRSIGIHWDPFREAGRRLRK